MKNSLFVGTFRGTEENLKNFMAGIIFSFEKKSTGKITILRSYNYVMGAMKESSICTDGKKEIYAIEMKTEEMLLSDTILTLRDAAIQFNIYISFVKDNIQEMKTEFVSINNNGQIDYKNEAIDPLSLV